MLTLDGWTGGPPEAELRLACVLEVPIKGPLREARQVGTDAAVPQVVRVASPPLADAPRAIPNAFRSS